jgi:hypothetical protein
MGRLWVFSTYVNSTCTSARLVGQTARMHTCTTHHVAACERTSSPSVRACAALRNSSSGKYTALSRPGEDTKPDLRAPPASRVGPCRGPGCGRGWAPIITHVGGRSMLITPRRRGRGAAVVRRIRSAKRAMRPVERTTETTSNSTRSPVFSGVTVGARSGSL